MRSISARHTATLRPCYALLSALCELWVVIWICDSQEWHWIMTLSRQLFGIKSYGWHQVGHRLWCRLYTCIAWCTLHHIICTRQRHMHYSTPYALQHLMQNNWSLLTLWLLVGTWFVFNGALSLFLSVVCTLSLWEVPQLEHSDQCNFYFFLLLPMVWYFWQFIANMQAYTLSRMTWVDMIFSKLRLHSLSWRCCYA